MNIWEKRLENLTNLAIIVAALALVGVIGYKFLRTAESTLPESIKDGQILTLHDVNWAENKQTLILVLQEDCRFCNESSPFYKRLTEKIRNNNQTKIIAFFPTQTDKAKAHLKEQGVEIADVRQASPDSLQVRGTPTLILVNEQGKVVDSWVGKLPTEEEEKVLQRIL